MPNRLLSICFSSMAISFALFAQFLKRENCKCMFHFVSPNFLCRCSFDFVHCWFIFVHAPQRYINFVAEHKFQLNIYRFFPVALNVCIRAHVFHIRSSIFFSLVQEKVPFYRVIHEYRLRQTNLASMVSVEDFFFYSAYINDMEFSRFITINVSIIVDWCIIVVLNI